MSFINPLGLLGLIGIPVLILIYILKSKYQEYSVSSTFLWELSEKFLTKKSPLSRLSGLLNLILQILIVLFLSFALANPIITIPNNAKNYVLIVDDSASMNISTRFEDSKNEMIKLVNDAKDGSKFTIIIAGSEASVVIEKQNEKEKVIDTINKLKTTNLASSVSNGLAVAQSYFDEDPSLNVYLFTDIEYENYNNIEIVNVSNQLDYNAAINSLYLASNEDNLTFKGEIISYNEDKELTLNLLLDGKVVKAFTEECKKDETKTFTVETELKDFKEAKVIITTNDSLSVDNEYIYHGTSSIDEYNVLLVSQKPFYLESILKVLGNNKITVTNTLTQSSGYDLYIYDSLTPTTLPTDGAVWLFNAKTNITNAGFAVQNYISVDNGATLIEEKNNSNISVYKTLTNGLTGNKVSVKEYNVYSLISSFTTIMSYDNHPMIFAGLNNSNNRQVVFSFDLHNSNFPLLLDYIILMNNMIKYSLPSLCDQNVFSCGDELNLNILPNLESIRINTPSNYSTYLPISTNVATFKLDEIGTYNIEAIINGVKKEYNIFVSFPKDEQNTIMKVKEIEIVGEKKDISFDSSIQIQWILFIIVLILCVIEWEVYVYEQRNVR